MNSCLKAYQQHIETLIKQQLDALPNTTLSEAMRHTFGPQSKLLRPLLVFSAAHSIGTPAPEQQQLIETAATSIECIHVYSLIHDDLPAMDNDALRRGQQSCHLAFDEATAILAGDALLTLAFELLSQPPTKHSTVKLELIQTLAQASGPSGMALGQALDLSEMTLELKLEQLETIYQLKTGKLIEAAISMGGIIARADNTQQGTLIDFAQTFGLAFQIRDDLIDELCDSDKTGKPKHSDSQRQKPTYPSILGLTQCQTLLAELKEKAVAQLQALPNAAHLESLCEWALAPIKQTVS